MFEDELGRLDAVEKRHGDVHDDDVRGQGRGKRDGVAAVIGFTDHFEIVLALEKGTEAGAHDGVIVS